MARDYVIKAVLDNKGIKEQLGELGKMSNDVLGTLSKAQIKPDISGLDQAVDKMQKMADVSGKAKSVQKEYMALQQTASAESIAGSERQTQALIKQQQAQQSLQATIKTRVAEEARGDEETMKKKAMMSAQTKELAGDVGEYTKSIIENMKATEALADTEAFLADVSEKTAKGMFSLKDAQNECAEFAGILAERVVKLEDALSKVDTSTSEGKAQFAALTQEMGKTKDTMAQLSDAADEYGDKQQKVAQILQDSGQRSIENIKALGQFGQSLTALGQTVGSVFGEATQGFTNFASSMATGMSQWGDFMDQVAAGKDKGGFQGAMQQASAYMGMVQMGAQIAIQAFQMVDGAIRKHETAIIDAGKEAQKYSDILNKFGTTKQTFQDQINIVNEIAETNASVASQLRGQIGDLDKFKSKLAEIQEGFKKTRIEGETMAAKVAMTGGGLFGWMQEGVTNANKMAEAMGKVRVAIQDIRSAMAEASTAFTEATSGATTYIEGLTKTANDMYIQILEKEGKINEARIERLRLLDEEKKKQKDILQATIDDLTAKREKIALDNQTIREQMQSITGLGTLDKSGLVAYGGELKKTIDDVFAKLKDYQERGYGKDSNWIADATKGGLQHFQESFRKALQITAQIGFKDVDDFRDKLSRHLQSILTGDASKLKESWSGYWNFFPDFSNLAQALSEIVPASGEAQASLEQLDKMIADLGKQLISVDEPFNKMIANQKKLWELDDKKKPDEKPKPKPAVPIPEWTDKEIQEAANKLVTTTQQAVLDWNKTAGQGDKKNVFLEILGMYDPEKWSDKMSTVIMAAMASVNDLGMTYEEAIQTYDTLKEKQDLYKDFSVKGNREQYDSWQILIDKVKEFTTLQEDMVSQVMNAAKSGNEVYIDQMNELLQPTKEIDKTIASINTKYDNAREALKKLQATKPEDYSNLEAARKQEIADAENLVELKKRLTDAEKVRADIIDQINENAKKEIENAKAAFALEKEWNMMRLDWQAQKKPDSKTDKQMLDDFMGKSKPDTGLADSIVKDVYSIIESNKLNQVMGKLYAKMYEGAGKYTIIELSEVDEDLRQKMVGILGGNAENFKTLYGVDVPMVVTGLKQTSKEGLAMIASYRAELSSGLGEIATASAESASKIGDTTAKLLDKYQTLPDAVAGIEKKALEDLGSVIQQEHEKRVQLAQDYANKINEAYNSAIEKQKTLTQQLADLENAIAERKKTAQDKVNDYVYRSKLTSNEKSVYDAVKTLEKEYEEYRKQGLSKAELDEWLLVRKNELTEKFDEDQRAQFDKWWNNDVPAIEKRVQDAWDAEQKRVNDLKTELGNITDLVNTLKIESVNAQNAVMNLLTGGDVDMNRQIGTLGKLKDTYDDAKLTYDEWKKKYEDSGWVYKYGQDQAWMMVDLPNRTKEGFEAWQKGLASYRRKLLESDPLFASVLAAEDMANERIRIEKNLATNLADIEAEIAKNAADEIAKIPQALDLLKIDPTSQQAKDIIESGTDFGNALAKAIKDGLIKGIDDIVGGGSGEPGSGSGDGGNSGNGLMSNANRTQGKVPAESPWKTQAKIDANEFIDLFKDALKDLQLDGEKEPGKTIKDKFTVFGYDIADSLFDPVRDLIDTMPDEGKRLMDGLANGIRSGKNSLVLALNAAILSSIQSVLATAGASLGSGNKVGPTGKTSIIAIEGGSGFGTDSDFIAWQKRNPGGDEDDYRASGGADLPSSGSSGSGSSTGSSSGSGAAGGSKGSATQGGSDLDSPGLGSQSSGWQLFSLPPTTVQALTDIATAASEVVAETQDFKASESTMEPGVSSGWQTLGEVDTSLSLFTPSKLPLGDKLKSLLKKLMEPNNVKQAYDSRKSYLSTSSKEYEAFKKALDIAVSSSDLDRKAGIFNSKGSVGENAEIFDKWYDKGLVKIDPGRMDFDMLKMFVEQNPIAKKDYWLQTKLKETYPELLERAYREGVMTLVDTKEIYEGGKLVGHTQDPGAGYSSDLTLFNNKEEFVGKDILTFNEFLQKDYNDWGKRNGKTGGLTNWYRDRESYMDNFSDKRKSELVELYKKYVNETRSEKFKTSTESVSDILTQYGDTNIGKLLAGTNSDLITSLQLSDFGMLGQGKIDKMKAIFEGVDTTKKGELLEKLAKQIDAVFLDTSTPIQQGEVAGGVVQGDYRKVTGNINISQKPTRTQSKIVLAKLLGLPDEYIYARGWAMPNDNVNVDNLAMEEVLKNIGMVEGAISQTKGTSDEASKAISQQPSTSNAKTKIITFIDELKQAGILNEFSLKGIKAALAEGIQTGALTEQEAADITMNVIPEALKPSKITGLTTVPGEYNLTKAINESMFGAFGSFVGANVEGYRHFMGRPWAGDYQWRVGGFEKPWNPYMYYEGIGVTKDMVPYNPGQLGGGYLEGMPTEQLPQQSDLGQGYFPFPGVPMLPWSPKSMQETYESAQPIVGSESQIYVSVNFPNAVLNFPDAQSESDGVETLMTALKTALTRRGRSMR